MNHTHTWGSFLLAITLATTTAMGVGHHAKSISVKPSLGATSSVNTNSRVKKPPVVATSTPPITSGEVRMTAYTTGYGWPDNTPAGAAISDSVIHTLAGGTGTYQDPITVAVGHTITGGKDILDYKAGTLFYVPNLRKYFIAEDTCGDGNTPQNGPCHTGYQGHVWIDLWVGGQGGNKSAVLGCEDTITDLHLVILNPSANYQVVPGPVFGTSCAQQFGDTVMSV